ncbi:hypothetical protein DYB36_005179 [Aphanomyces astaci]|uniref:Rab-GAP TBC domain-containing protein n=1 Tax=Aphanomyces astaci TaxID=112090 RepID=A0A397AJH0_APHAT|nr:hypothetical protein DYB36_005179 [Aphanomyces astaci]
MTSPRRTRTTSLDSARQESLRIGLELDLMNQSIHKELGRLHTVHSSVLTTLLNHLPYGMLPVFSFLGPADVAAALSVCRSWLSMLTAYCTLSQAFSHPHERWQYWQRYLLIQTTKTSPDLDHLHIDDIVVSRVCTDDIRNIALLDQEVHRTTFFPKESMYMPALLSNSSPSGTTTSLPRIGSYSSKSPALKSLHQKLHHLLSTFAHQYPQVGYGHGMTFVGAALLSTLQYDMDASYRVFVTFMEKHGMHHLWHASPSSFGAGLPRRLCQLERCVDVYAPEVAAHLRAHSISTSMFASSWILSLFLNDRSLPPSTCMHILDTFLVEGWLAMYALYVGLIVVHAKELVVATDEASILHALLSLPKHLAMQGLGPYRMCALTTLSPSLATTLSLEIEQEPHP